MIQQRITHIIGTQPLIAPSQSSFRIGWQWKDKDYYDLDVTPGALEWTITFEDTGDGTTWVSALPSSGTGNASDAYMNAEVENDTGLERSCNVRFSDNAGEATDVVLVVTQDANPA